MIELSSCLWIPESDFTPHLRGSLTVKVYALDGTATSVESFRSDVPGRIGIPRVYGMKLISNVHYVDSRSDGRAVKFPHSIKLRDEQGPFVADMMSAARQGDFIAKAGTGKGKTVCALSVIQQLGRSAAIVVDQEFLLEQWVERCVEHLKIKPTDIGIVQGQKISYDKPITICMMQTLARKDLPEEFYKAFGVVVFDEAHVAGAPTFSRVLMQFPARVRFGLSATPNRKDALDRVIGWNLGSIRAQMDAEHHKSSVYVVESLGVYSWNANNSKMVGKYINEVADDALRNLEIVEAIKWLYNKGRNVLVIGDRIEHLCSLLSLASMSGVPTGDMGLLSKSKTVLVYEKDPRPLRKPVGYERGTEYSPVRLSLVQKTIPKKERDEVKEKARVIFATYGSMAKGVDIPRLSAGIDVTPRSDATQVLGRVLRTSPGKLRPIWITIADTNSFRSLYQLVQRLRDYTTSNAEVFLWDRTKGKKLLDIREYRRELEDRISLLRQSRIITSLDGNNTLVIPSTQSDSDDYLARPTGRISRSRPAGSGTAY